MLLDLNRIRDWDYTYVNGTHWCGQPAKYRRQKI